MASGGKFLNKNEEPKKRNNGGSSQPRPKWVKPVVITVAIVLALIVLIGGGLLIYVKSMLGYVNRAEYEEKNEDMSFEDMIAALATTGETEPFETTTEATTVPYSDGNYGKTGKVINILVIGQDMRPDEPGKNSDTIMLCSLNKETKVMTISSFLRDSYVKLANYKSHTCGMYRINSAYAMGYLWGGDAGAFEMIDNTLINNYGATIDHNIEISLDCFEKILETVGPIQIDLDETEVKYLNAYLEKGGYDRRLEVGVNDLYSVTALAYARMRHDTFSTKAQDGSDMKRTNRQRKVVSAVLDNIKHLSISEINNLAKQILPTITTDMSDADIATYLLEVVPVLPYLSIESIQIPQEGTYHGEMKDLDGNGFKSGVLVPNLEPNRLLIQAICNGSDRP